MILSLADRRTLAIALGAELALALAGWGVCWLLGLPLTARLWPASGVLVPLSWGLVATLPMAVMFFALLRARWRPLDKMRRQVRRMVGELLDSAGLSEIVLISLSAGFGEEILFRGALQPMFALWLGPWGGVAATALLFGLAHPMSYGYFAVATLCGVYLGAVTELSGNLIPAIVAHGLYDLVALWWLQRSPQPGLTAKPNAAEDL